MKQAILELIDRKIESYTQTLNVGEIAALQELRSEIEKMEEWIPVTERLPEEEDGYMLYSQDIGICEGWFCKSANIWENWNTKKIKEVTHWQPLPLPPSPSYHD